MKIAVMTPYWLMTKGGISTYTYNLAEELKKIPGNEVVVISRDGGHGAIRIKGNKFVFLLRSLWVLRKVRPAVIHCHGLEVLLISAVLYRSIIANNVRIVYTFHTQPTKSDHEGSAKKLFGLKTRIFRLALLQCDWVTYVCDALRVEIGSMYNLPIRSSAITPPGIRKKIIAKEQLELFRTQNSLETSFPIICTIGVLAWELKAKGIGILIKAFKSVVEKYPHGKLLIVGDGFYRGYLEKLVLEGGMENNVIFCGYMDDPGIALAHANIYCHISFQDGLPHAILEAMISRKPIIASRIGGIPEVIISGKTGVLIDSNESSLYKELFRLLEYPELAAEYGNNAESFAQAEYLWPAVTRKIAALYH